MFLYANDINGTDYNKKMIVMIDNNAKMRGLLGDSRVINVSIRLYMFVLIFIGCNRLHYSSLGKF